MISKRRGIPLSPEHRQKLSDAGKRRPPRSIEWRQKIAAALIGKTRPIEVREKIAAAKRGKPIPSLQGKPKSDAHKAALKAAWIIRREREYNDKLQQKSSAEARSG